MYSFLSISCFNNASIHGDATMTKYQLLKALEPFNDEVEIVFQDREHKFLYNPNMYYGLNSDNEGQIIFASNKQEGKKWVELKV